MGLETDNPVFSTTIQKLCEVFSSLFRAFLRTFCEHFFEVRAPKMQLALWLEFLEISTSRYIPESWRTATVHSNADNPKNPNLLLFWISDDTTPSIINNLPKRRKVKSSYEASKSMCVSSWHDPAPNTGRRMAMRRPTSSYTKSMSWLTPSIGSPKPHHSHRDVHGGLGHTTFETVQGYLSWLMLDVGRPTPQGGRGECERDSGMAFMCRLG